MSAEVSIPARRREKVQAVAIGVVKESASVAVHALFAFSRKVVPWERVPLVTKTANNAIDALQSWLAQQSESTIAYQAIFGTDSSRRQGKQRQDRNITFTGKGWNSVTYSFTSNDRRWVVKIGSMMSPDGVFFLNPSNENHAKELQHNLKILQEGMEHADLPDFISLPQVVAHTRFRNFAGVPEKRTVQIMPFEEVVPLNQVAAEVKENPELADKLNDELKKYSKLRLWLIQHHRSDFDLDGLDNVSVVRVPTKDGQGTEYHLRVLDIGLRTHGLNTPLADAKQDISGILNSVKLRMALAGEMPLSSRKIVKIFLSSGIPRLLAGTDISLEGENQTSAEIYRKYIAPEVTIMLEGRGLRRRMRQGWLERYLVELLQRVQTRTGEESRDRDPHQISV